MGAKAREEGLAFMALRPVSILPGRQGPVNLSANLVVGQVG